MWVAVMLMCANASAFSCTVIAKAEQPFYNKELCLKEAEELAEILKSKGAIAAPSCIEIGVSL
tara:strand:- start:223 stop:411 length:189 start_codon:yes stop_codon:yes gene_type:complete